MNYSWQSQEEFDTWHQVVKEALGIPYPNRNAKTGEVDENSTWTMNYTLLRADDNGVLHAKVEDKIAQKFADGLGTPYEPFYNYE